MCVIPSNNSHRLFIQKMKLSITQYLNYSFFSMNQEINHLTIF